MATHLTRKELNAIDAGELAAAIEAAVKFEGVSAPFKGIDLMPLEKEVRDRVAEEFTINRLDPKDVTMFDSKDEAIWGHSQDMAHLYLEQVAADEDW
jgi:hypothetical protein